MAWDSNSFRRWSGGVYMAAALGMLIAGVTVLKDRLQGLVFVYYWLACTGLTGLTLLIALLDFRAVRRRALREQKELLLETLEVIEKEKAERESKK